MTRPVFEDVDDVAAERRRWRPCLGRYGFGKISLAAYARMIFERPGVLGRCRQTSSCRAAIAAGPEREGRVQAQGCALSGWDGLGKTLQVAYARAIFERPGVCGRRR